ncbi:MAG: glycosyltransferase family 1 protein [Gemmatimonadota bacterium]|nr:glycosyltransferase family 1 protein [Gemmatimonadota bacterium]
MSEEIVSAVGLRVAIFTDTYSPQVNGVVRTLERLTEAVQARGGAVRVYTVSDNGAIEQPHIERYKSVPFWAYKELRLAWPSSRIVQRSLENFRPTVIHAATQFGMGLVARRVARKLNVPFVTSYHTSLSAYAAYYRLGVLSEPGWSFLRWFHNSGLRTYCPTRAIMNEVEGHGFQNTARWSRGVDTDRFSPTFRSVPLRASMGADDDTLVVTYVGRLAAEKGLEVVARAVQLAARMRPGKVAFACVGDGPYDAQVRQLVPAGSWLPGKLLGTKLSEAYASGDVFLFPSTTDTFGNVMLEAMASGLPVIGADVGPTRELLGENRGWLVPAGDAEACAQAIVNLIDDPVRLRQAREGALEFASQSTWNGVWNSLLTDYRTLLKS